MTLRQAVLALASAIILSAVVGFSFPGDDLSLIIPRVLQMEDPGLFTNDIYFNKPAQSYELVAFMASQLSKIRALPVSLAVVMIITHLILVVSVWRAASYILKGPVSFAIVLFVMILAGPRMMGGIITGNSYHPQFTSYALFVLALSFIIEMRLYTALFIMALSAVFHPLIGLYGLLFVALGALSKKVSIKEKLKLAAMAVIVLFIVIVPSIKSGGVDLTAKLWKEYVNILLYIRAPHHHLPYVWSVVDIFRSVIIIIAGLLLAIRTRGFILTAFILSLALCLIGIVNNISIQIPKVVIAYPARMAQVILFLFWALMAAFLDQAVRRLATVRMRRIVLAAALGMVFIFVALSKFPDNISLSSEKDPSWIGVCYAAEKNIDKDSAVIIPPDKCDFQYLSKRSAFVTAKHFPFHPMRAIEWVKRMSYLHLVILPDDISRIKDRLDIDGAMYKKITEADVDAIHKLYPFVRYCIVDKEEPLPFRKLYENRRYSLYAITPPKGAS